VLSTEGAARFVPDTTSLTALAQAAEGCQGCPLFANATQTVFGEGPRTAPLVLVGEQPGDQEDRQGVPFVGPAGRVLWQCLEQAGIQRDDVYVTNAVKHFKHTDSGKRRLHKKPNTAEIEACHPWIEAELRSVRARALVALGATAARSLVGKTVAIASNRGVQLELGGRPLWITYHPSAVLRADDRAAEIRSAIIDDLRLAAAWLHR
jgi:uracil-DNA glycosylase